MFLSSIFLFLTHLFISVLLAPGFFSLQILVKDFDLELFAASEAWVESTRKRAVQRNVDKISLTVSSFLDWAELTGQKTPGNLFVQNVEDVIVAAHNNLNKIFGDRIVVTGKVDFQILCNPLHLEQLIINVLSNSLKYSSEKVEVSYGDSRLSIRDFGPGVPKDVISRIGSPFNRSGTTVSVHKGFGLGLAWVKTICDLYCWEFSFSTENGTVFTVKFRGSLFHLGILLAPFSLSCEKAILN